MIGRLPDCVEIDGVSYELRTDYRNVLDTFLIFNDPDLTIKEKWFTAVYMMYEAFNGYDDLETAICNGFDLDIAIKRLEWFYSAGKPDTDNKPAHKPIFDWEQDEQMIFASVNHVANMEIRSVEYLHWWTFLSYFNEINEGMFSYVIGIRRKKQKGKPLDKSEQQFCKENPDIINLVERRTIEETEFIDHITELL